MLSSFVFDEAPLKASENIKKDPKYFKPNEFCDALDSRNIWCVARILDNKNNILKVEFEGWPHQNITEFPLDSEKIQFFRKHTIGYTGKINKKNRYKKQMNYSNFINFTKIIKEIKPNYMNIACSTDITQLNRGQLFFFLEYLLTNEFDIFNKKGIEKEIVEIIYDYLDIFSKALPSIHTLNHFFTLNSKYENAFLIHRECAMVECIHENVINLLMIFGLFERTNLFYERFSEELKKIKYKESDENPNYFKKNNEEIQPWKKNFFIYVKKKIGIKLFYNILEWYHYFKVNVKDKGPYRLEHYEETAKNVQKLLIFFNEFVDLNSIFLDEFDNSFQLNFLKMIYYYDLNKIIMIEHLIENKLDLRKKSGEFIRMKEEEKNQIDKIKDEYEDKIEKKKHNQIFQYERLKSQLNRIEDELFKKELMKNLTYRYENIPYTSIIKLISFNEELLDSNIPSQDFYLCKICSNIVINPKSCDECEEIFCFKCLEECLINSNKCPFCRNDPFKDRKINKFIKSSINSIMIKCPFKCPNGIIYEYLDKHFITCINCPKIYTCNVCNITIKDDQENVHFFDLLEAENFEINSNEISLKIEFKKHLINSENEMSLLNKHILGEKLLQHENECEAFKIKCVFCFEFFHKTKISSHLVDCENRLIECGNCNMTYKAKFTEAHKEEYCDKIKELCHRFNEILNLD